MMVVFGSDRTNHVGRSAKFGPEGRTMHTPGEAPGGHRNPGYDNKLELRLGGATLA